MNFWTFFFQITCAFMCWLIFSTLKWPLVLFTKFLISGLTCEIENQLHDWLLSTSPINHPVGYLIHGLTWELKISWLMPYDYNSAVLPFFRSHVQSEGIPKVIFKGNISLTKNLRSTYIDFWMLWGNFSYYVSQAEHTSQVCSKKLSLSKTMSCLTETIFFTLH